MATYYVYQHRRLDTNEIFYVGKGKDLRKDSFKNRNKHWRHISESAGFVSEILISNIEEEFALLIEQEVICKYRKLGYNLVNYTNGGEGISGYKHTTESKQRMSEKQKLRFMTSSAWIKGKSWSDDVKKKLSESHKGLIPWNKGVSCSQETKEKMRQAKIGLFSSYFWWTDGVNNTRSQACPGENWYKGRSKRDS